MSDRYISPHPKPTPYERELLTILMEEAAEVQVMASKILRFGAGDGYPGTGRINTQDLAKEIGEFNYLVMRIRECRIIKQFDIDKGFGGKAERLAKYMQEPNP